MKKIVIIGASGYGGETLGVINAINVDKQTYEGDVYDILGFIDDNKAKHGTEVFGYEVLGDMSWFDKAENHGVSCVIAIGDPVNKKKVYEMLKDKGIEFPSIIHPHAIIVDTVKLGEGCIISAGNILNMGVRIGDFVILNLSSVFGHFTTIGNFSTVNPMVALSGDCNIGEGCYLGTNCSIIQKINIGCWSKIGAGAVVLKDIPNKVTAVGVPAKVVKKLYEDYPYDEFDTTKCSDCGFIECSERKT